jgi:hypothetical protein
VTRSVRAEVRKVTSTRLWIGLLGGGAAMAAIGAIVLFVIAGTPEGEASGLTEVRTAGDVRELIFSGAIVTAFALVLGATMATAEHRYGTAAGTALTVPHRGRVLTAKMLAAVPLGFAFGLVGGLLPLAVAAVGLAVRGTAFPAEVSLVTAVLLVGLQGAYVAAFGAGVGVAVRSQLAAILGLLGWLFIAEQVAVAFLPDLAKWLPFAGAQAAFGSPAEALVSMPTGGALIVSYLVSAWLAAWWLEGRRDV